MTDLKINFIDPIKEIPSVAATPQNTQTSKSTAVHLGLDTELANGYFQHGIQKCFASTLH